MSSQQPIFITGRVRSGSTMLWNIYDQSPGHRAFYQPCHDNLLAHIRHTEPMESHRGVSDYWGAYRPLIDQLPTVHQPAFGITRMHLDVDEPWPELRDYIQFLLDQCTPDETPVLQFNAMCFRLPWLRAQFPNARIVHLWREPRESWVSMVRHLPRNVWDKPDLADAYDLLQWSVDLTSNYPFLFDESMTTSYARAHALWSLSRLAGDRIADTVISYSDEFQKDVKATLNRMVDLGLLDKKNAKHARRNINPSTEMKWPEVHPANWYADIESANDTLFQKLGLTEHYGKMSLNAIRNTHAEAWNAIDQTSAMAAATRAMLEAYSATRGEVTRLLHEVRAHHES